MLPEQYRKAVIRMNGDVAQTFLVDGFVAGMWRVERAASCSSRSPALTPRTERAEDEAARLEAFLAA